jgi:hypothetical protein
MRGVKTPVVGVWRGFILLFARPFKYFTLETAPAGGVAAAAPEGDALACPSAPTSTSTRWALVTP